VILKVISAISDISQNARMATTRGYCDL